MPGPTTFTIDLHDDFVKRHGDVVLWRRAYKCPCGATPDANRSLLSCAGCHGLGLLYDAPVKITGLVTGVTRDKTLMDWGFIEPGDMLLGLAPDEPNFLSENDLVRITWQQGQPYEGDTIRRDQNIPDVLSYDPEIIEKCFTIDPATGLITTYNLNTDFTIVGNGLTWVTGHGPPSGDIYAIKYSAFFDWIVFFGPKDRFENGTNLGQRVVLRKRHLTGLPPLFTGNIPTQPQVVTPVFLTGPEGPAGPAGPAGPRGPAGSGQYQTSKSLTVSDSPYSIQPGDTLLVADGGVVMLLPPATGSKFNVEIMRSSDPTALPAIVRPVVPDTINNQAGDFPLDIQFEAFGFHDFRTGGWLQV